MRKIYVLLIVLLISTLAAFGQDSYYVSSSGGLNLRKGPGAKYETLQSIPEGSKVVLVKQENEEWWKVKYNNQEGYVAAKYLSEDKPSNSQNNRNQSNPNSQNQSNRNRNNNNTSASSQRSSAKSTNAYRYGIGLRAGDPAGLNLIKYLPNGKGLELNIGRTAFYGYDFKRYFERYDDFNDFHYIDARFKSAVGVQLHYLSFQDINDLQGLQWYYGFGGQARVISVDYLYEYRVFDKWEKRWDVVRDIDFGVDGTLGLNYNFQEIPISLFADITLFGEIYDNPLRFWFQGGLGARYNF